MTVSANPDSLVDWLWLWRCPGIGPVSFARLLKHFGSPTAAKNADRETLKTIGLKAPAIDCMFGTMPKAVNQDMEWAEIKGNRIITIQDPLYPNTLKSVARPPPILFSSGNQELLNQTQLAMVGSRNPSPNGRENAHAFAKYLANNGITITSGLALGIDGAAHQGALDANGWTIAITGTGLDTVYPRRHQKLAEQIKENGLIISEFPTGTAPAASNFPRRNRIISGLSSGVLVVEATLRSGSLITARYALEQGREVFAIPGSIHNPLARGCHALIRQGAKLVETAQDILEELGPFVTQPTPNNSTPNNSPELDPEYIKLLRCIGHESVSSDELVECSGLTPQAVSSMLLLLELQGLVASAPGGLYTRVGMGA